MWIDLISFYRALPSFTIPDAGSIRKIPSPGCEAMYPARQSFRQRRLEEAAGSSLTGAPACSQLRV